MARNPSTGFRKIDVDQYGDDLFKDEVEPEPQSPAAVGVDEQEVRRLLQAGRLSEALKQLLAAAPLGSKNQQLRDSQSALVVQVLLTVKTSEIDKTVEGLSKRQTYSISTVQKLIRSFCWV